jgi:hypothetical protein
MRQFNARLDLDKERLQFEKDKSEKELAVKKQQINKIKNK